MGRQGVVPKARDFSLKDAQKGTQVKGSPEVYHVVSGQRQVRCSCRLPELAGWAPSDQVVLLEQADEFFTSQIQGHPGESFPHLMRAIVSLAQSGDLDRAIGDLSEAIRLAPEIAEPIVIRAEVWKAQGQPDKAVADCETALALDPQVGGCAGSPGVDLGRWPRVRQGDRRLQRSDSPRPAGRSRHTSAVPLHKAKKGKSTRRSPTWAPPSALNPELPDAYVVRAVAWKHKGETDKAIADLNEAIRLEPTNAHAYHSRGLLWNQKKAFDKAIDDFSQAIRIEPANASGLLRPRIRLEGRQAV